MKFLADSRRVFHKKSFWRPRQLVGYFRLYLWFCLQIRSKMMTNYTDDRIKSLNRTNLILRKLICQTPTNRSKVQRPVQCDTLFVHKNTGVVSPKTELSQPKFQSCSGFLEVPLRYRVTIREFHEWHDTTFASFSARIPTSQRGILSTAVSTTKTKSVCIPCWWRRTVVLSIQVANVVLTTVVADQSEARTQSREAVAKMALASDVVVVQVSRQLPTPRVVHRQRIQRRLHSSRQGKGNAKETQQQSQLENT